MSSRMSRSKRHDPRRRHKEKTMEYLKPEGAIEDMGINYFPLQSEKGQTGYIRPNNFSKTKEI